MRSTQGNQDKLVGSTSTMTAVSGNFFCGAEFERAGERFSERGAVRRFQHELKAVVAAQARERRGGGTENLHAVLFERREISGQRARPANRVLDFAVAHEHGRERGERRVVQHAPEVRFLFVERNVILLRGVLNRVVLGIIRFDQHFSGLTRRVPRAPPPA